MSQQHSTETDGRHFQPRAVPARSLRTRAASRRTVRRETGQVEILSTPWRTTDPQRLRQCRAVLRAAARIEPNWIRVLDWFREDPITGLGGTAQELVESGRHGEVLDFLRRVRHTPRSHR